MPTIGGWSTCQKRLRSVRKYLRQSIVVVNATRWRVIDRSWNRFDKVYEHILIPG